MDRNCNRRGRHLLASTIASLPGGSLFGAIECPTIFDLRLPPVQNTLADARPLVATMSVGRLVAAVYLARKGTSQKNNNMSRNRSIAWLSVNSMLPSDAVLPK